MHVVCDILGPGNKKRKENGPAFQEHSLGGGDTCGKINVIEDDRHCDRNHALFRHTKKIGLQLYFIWQGKAEDFIDKVTSWTWYKKEKLRSSG